jgi:hypothetical protein
VGERHAELLRQVADLTAERDALRRQVDAAKPTPTPDDDRYVIVPIQTPDGVVRWRIPRAPLTIPAPEQATADPQRTGKPPQPAQEPRTPAPGSPSTPETLSERLSAPDRGTA